MVNTLKCETNNIPEKSNLFLFDHNRKHFRYYWKIKNNDSVNRTT